MKRVVLGLMAAVVLAACAGHEKAGDRAAAVGDWKSAYSAYRTALANDPDSPELKAKYDQAREQALQDAQKRAQACAQVEDWDCALAESDFALSVDGGNAEIAAFRARAATQVALRQLQFASEQAQRGQFPEAVDLMERATQLSSAPEVRSRADEVRRQVVTNGRIRADGYRKERNIIAAHQLAQLVSSLDASQAGWAQGIAAEYERFATAEYERLALEGDAARARQEWPLAQERYRAALNMKPGGRAVALEQYVTHVLNGEQRLGNRDWNGATAAYRSAVQSGQDDGYAARQLDRVQLRPYRIAVRSVMVVPTRPDGNAWVGVANPIFSRLAQRLTDMAERRGLSDVVLEMAMAIPNENRPQLRVEAVLPDGLRLTTPARGGIYTGFDSEFITLSNAFDEQRITFQVYVDDPRGGELVGAVDVPVRELVEQREVSLKGRSILSLKLSAAIGEGREPGSFLGMARVVPMPPPGHAATPAP